MPAVSSGTSTSSVLLRSSDGVLADWVHAQVLLVVASLLMSLLLMSFQRVKTLTRLWEALPTDSHGLKCLKFLAARAKGDAESGT